MVLGASDLHFIPPVWFWGLQQPQALTQNHHRGRDGRAAQAGLLLLPQGFSLPLRCLRLLLGTVTFLLGIHGVLCLCQQIKGQKEKCPWIDS